MVYSAPTLPAWEVEGRALIVVKLPEEGQLTIDDSTTKQEGEERTFVTPPLEPGKQFTYTLAVTVKRGDKLLTRKREVVVRSARTSSVDFDTEFVALAEKR